MRWLELRRRHVDHHQRDICADVCGDNNRTAGDLHRGTDDHDRLRSPVGSRRAGIPRRLRRLHRRRPRPLQPRPPRRIERLYTGPNLEFTISQLDGFVEQNWVARPAEEPSRTIILLSPQFLPDRTDVVELVVCPVNTERFVEVGGAPDGSDSLVTDEVTVLRGLVRMRLIDGQWKSNSGEQDTINCDGVGTPIPDSALNSLDQGPCGYTYPQSSPDDDPYQLTITTNYTITYTTSTGANGTLTPITRSVTIDYDVDEIQTIGVSN